MTYHTWIHSVHEWRQQNRQAINDAEQRTIWMNEWRRQYAPEPMETAQ